MAKDAKLNNLLGMKDFSEREFVKPTKTTKRTDVAKDVLESAYVLGKDVFGEKPKSHEEHTTSKGLNNLISLDNFTQKVPDTNAKPSKRTEVAKDILKENTGKDVFGEKAKSHDKIEAKDLANLISLDDFSKSAPDMNSKATKRTGVAKDVLEKKKEEECDDDDHEDKPKKKGLSAGQKKLPKAMQDAILKKQKK